MLHNMETEGWPPSKKNNEGSGVTVQKDDEAKAGV